MGKIGQKMVKVVFECPLMINGSIHVLLFLDIDATFALLRKEVNGQTYVWL